MYLRNELKCVLLKLVTLQKSCKCEEQLQNRCLWFSQMQYIVSNVRSSFSLHEMWGSHSDKAVDVGLLVVMLCQFVLEQHTASIITTETLVSTCKSPRHYSQEGQCWFPVCVCVCARVCVCPCMHACIFLTQIGYLKMWKIPWHSVAYCLY
jgi:hypothetical protein